MQATQCAIFAILTKHGFNTAGLAAIGPVLRGGEVRPGLWRRSIVPLRQAVEEAQANPLARPVFPHLTATPEHNQPGVMAIPRGIIVDRQPGHPEEWGAAIRDRPNFMGTAFVTFNLTAILGPCSRLRGSFRQP
jgi:hypothetical protein